MEIISEYNRKKIQPLTMNPSKRASSACSSYKLNEKKQFQPLRTNRIISSQKNVDGIFKYTSLDKSPYKKNRRLDFQIFFLLNNTKNFTKNTDSERKNTSNIKRNGIPARHYSTIKLTKNGPVKKKEHISPDIKRDLKLIKDINPETLGKCFEMDKTYRNYLSNYKSPRLKDFSIELNQSERRVTFNI